MNHESNIILCFGYINTFMRYFYEAKFFPFDKIFAGRDDIFSRTLVEVLHNIWAKLIMR